MVSRLPVESPEGLRLIRGHLRRKETATQQKPFFSGSTQGRFDILYAIQDSLFKQIPEGFVRFAQAGQDNGFAFPGHLPEFRQFCNLVLEASARRGTVFDKLEMPGKVDKQAVSYRTVYLRHPPGHPVNQFRIHSPTPPNRRLTSTIPVRLSVPIC